MRDGKGARDRVTMLPEGLRPRLRMHMQRVRLLHERDLYGGWGRVQLPFALERKYPAAATLWGWQFLFPSATICRSPYDGTQVRHHVHPKSVQRAISEAARQVGLSQPVSPHTFRHCFATHLPTSSRMVRTYVPCRN